MDKIKVEINSTYSTGNIRAYATATINDSISIRGIKLMDDEMDGIYVSMPSRKAGNRDKVLCNIYADDFETELEEKLVGAYNKAIGVAQEMGEEPDYQCDIDMKNIHISIGSVYNSEENDGIRAYAVATIDENIDIKEIKVMDDGANLSVVMPRRKTVDGYKEVCSIVSEEYKVLLHTVVIDSYHQTLAQIQVAEMGAEQARNEELGQEQNASDEPVLGEEQSVVQEQGNTMQMGSM